jgi:hypothetical protein
VFDIEGKPEKERKIKALFPAVKYLSSEKGEKTPNALLRMAARAAGDFVLLLADDILLPPESAHSLYQKLKNSGERGPITPRVARERRFTPVWTGAKSSPAKILAGRAAGPSRRLRERKIDWIFSPCLFFKKEALFERKLRSRSLTRRNIFLWEKEKEWQTSPLFFEAVVYKKE